MMKAIYKKIWDLAKPYYKKGRPMDIDHIEWMMDAALNVCKAENVDDAILLPLVILHDVGYSEVPKNNPYNLDIRKAHMVAGAEIAKQILEKINYPDDKSKQIVFFVSVHDNWAFKDYDIYKKHKILSIFSDLDFMWMATPKGFPGLMKIRSIIPKQMIEYIETDDKIRKIPFATKTTKELYKKYISQRKKELTLSQAS